jgi:hypothetical protein
MTVDRLIDTKQTALYQEHIQKIAGPVFRLIRAAQRLLSEAHAAIFHIRSDKS